MHAPPPADRFIALHFDQLGVDLALRRAAGPRRGPLALVRGSTVAAACRRAAAAGVRAGDAVLQARGRCPAIRFAPFDPEAEARRLAAIVRLAARAGHDVAAVAPRTVVGAIPAGPGEEVRALVAAMGVASILGLAARPGIAGNALAAALLARHADGRRDGDRAPWIAAPGGTAEAVGRLPIEAMDLPPPVLDATRRAGLRTIGDLSALGRVRVAGRYGLDVARRLAAATAEGAHAPKTGAGAEIVPLRSRRVIAPATRRDLAGVLGGGALTAPAVRPRRGPAPVPGSASALVMAARLVRGRPVLAGLLSGTEDLSSVLVERFADGGALLRWRPEPVRQVGPAGLPDAPFVWRGRERTPSAPSARMADGAGLPGAADGWRVPTAGGADLWLVREGGEWSCGGAFA